MTKPEFGEVTVVYSKGSSTAETAVLSVGRLSSAGRAAILLVALMNLSAACGLYCLTWVPISRQSWAPSWWPAVSADTWISEVLLLKTPLYIPHAGQLFAMFGGRSGRKAPADANNGHPGTGGQAANATQPAADSPESDVGVAVHTTAMFPMRQRATVMVASAYGWETLVAAAVCALALAAGVGLGRISSAGLRRWMLWAALLAALALAGWAWHTWVQKGRQFSANDVRFGIAGLVGLFLLFGVSAGRGLIGFNRTAGVVLILLGLGSVAALELGARCDALTPSQATVAYQARIFGIHSAYGWLLLLMSFLVRPKSRRKIAVVKGKTAT